MIPHYLHFRDFISCQHGYIRKIIVMIKYIYYDKNLSDYQPLVLGIRNFKWASTSNIRIWSPAYSLSLLVTTKSKSYKAKKEREIH